MLYGLIPSLINIEIEAQRRKAIFPRTHHHFLPNTDLLTLKSVSLSSFS